MTKRRDLIASCVGDINTICYPFLLALFRCYKNVLSLHCHLHTFLVSAFCLAHPCPNPIISRFLPFLCKPTKLSHVICHLSSSNPTMPRISIWSTLLTLIMYVCVININKTYSIQHYHLSRICFKLSFSL